MRINVYAEEITDEVKLVKQMEKTKPYRTHPAVRFFLDSPLSLHQTMEDDDRSAVTFWLPHGHAYDVASIFRQAAGLCEQIAVEQGETHG